MSDEQGPRAPRRRRRVTVARTDDWREPEYISARLAQLCGDEPVEITDPAALAEIVDTFACALTRSQPVRSGAVRCGASLRYC